MNYSFQNIRFISASEKDLLDLVTKSKGPCAIHFAAAALAVEAHRDEALRRVLNDGWTIADGVPVRKAIQVFSPTFIGCRGTDFMKLFISQSSPSLGHYFLGTDSETLDKLMLSIKQLNPCLNIRGYRAPIFSQNWETILSASIEEIVGLNPQIIWLGMSSPKQNFIAHALTKHTKAQVFSVGAAFDFLAGTKKQAPILMQKSGTEWLFRLVTEPGRLWRRYLIGNVKFTFMLINHFRLNLFNYLRLK